MLDKRKSYGAIYGAPEVPGAKYEQGGKFFNGAFQEIDRDGNTVDVEPEPVVSEPPAVEPVEKRDKRVRVYELAKRLGLQNPELIAALKGAGFDVTNHMSFLDPDAVAWATEQFATTAMDTPADTPPAPPKTIVIGAR